MAIRKNKKRFDPRYFMDEKMEEPLTESGQKEKQIDDSGPRAEYLRRKAEDAEREKERRRRRQGPIDDNVGRHTRADHSVDHSLEEDLSHLSDPAVWEALGLGAAKLASIWVPLLGIGGLGIIIKDAIEYLKNTPQSSHEDALQHAVQKAESGPPSQPSHLLKTAVEANKFDDFEEFRRLIDDEELVSRLISATKDLKPTMGIRTGLSLAILKLKQGNSEHIENFISRYGSKEGLKEISQATQWVDIERGKAQPPGAYDAGAKRLATLVDKKMVNALKTVRQHWPNLGDVKRLEAYAKSELADEESKNAIAILSSLGKHVNEWCPECAHKRATSELPSDAQDVPMPGNLEERRRRLKKKRSK